MNVEALHAEVDAMSDDKVQMLLSFLEYLVGNEAVDHMRKEGQA